MAMSGALQAMVMAEWSSEFHGYARPARNSVERERARCNGIRQRWHTLRAALAGIAYRIKAESGSLICAEPRRKLAASACAPDKRERAEAE
jgi:hypothetical protein